MKHLGPLSAPPPRPGALTESLQISRLRFLSRPRPRPCKALFLRPVVRFCCVSAGKGCAEHSTSFCVASQNLGEGRPFSPSLILHTSCCYAKRWRGSGRLPPQIYNGTRRRSRNAHCSPRLLTAKKNRTALRGPRTSLRCLGWRSDGSALHDEREGRDRER
jgi:hypothetical protein